MKEAKNHWMVTLLAEYKGKLIGRAILYLSKGRGRYVGYLALMVRKEYRRMGIGEYLLRKTKVSWQTNT